MVSDIFDFNFQKISSFAAISEITLLELISQLYRVRSLCLRETQLDDNSLYKFSGSSLEMLDVSDTKVCE